MAGGVAFPAAGAGSGLANASGTECSFISSSDQSGVKRGPKLGWEQSQGKVRAHSASTPRGRSGSGAPSAAQHQSQGGGSSQGSDGRRGRVIQGKVVGKPKVTPRRAGSIGPVAGRVARSIAEAAQQGGGDQDEYRTPNGGSDMEEELLSNLPTVWGRASGAAPPPGPPPPPPGPENYRIDSGSDSDVDIALAKLDARWSYTDARAITQNNVNQVDARSVTQNNVLVSQ